MLGTALILAIFYAIFALLLRSLNKFRGALQEVMRGNFTVHLESTLFDRIFVIVDAFNDMVRSIRKSTVSKRYVERSLGLYEGNDDLVKQR